MAIDPAAQRGVAEYGVPLMPFERAELAGRRSDIGLLVQINDYGARFPESFAGAYVDNRASQAFVASFKEDAATHRAALVDLLPVEAQVEVLDVEWSSLELEGFVEAVQADRPWFDTIDASFVAAGRRITENRAYVKFEGAETAVRLIEDHFGRAPWLSVERQGPGPWLGPRGDLVVEIRDPAGARVLDARCELVAEDPDVDVGGEASFGGGDAGRCVIRNIPAVAYRLTVSLFVDGDHFEAVTTTRVSVGSGGTTVSVTVAPP